MFDRCAGAYLVHEASVWRMVEPYPASKRLFPRCAGKIKKKEKEKKCISNYSPNWYKEEKIVVITHKYKTSLYEDINGVQLLRRNLRIQHLKN